MPLSASSGGDWSDWTPLGRPDPEDRVASIAVAPNADGRLLLVASPADTGLVPTTPTTITPQTASSHSLWQRTQQVPGDSSIGWRPWSPLVSTPGLSVLRLASDPIQRLHLFGVLASGAGISSEPDVSERQSLG